VKTTLPEVIERIQRFFAEGCTGEIYLEVKDGYLNAYHMREVGRVNVPDPDLREKARLVLK
jgi:hypothetical protein